eukprot:NODE_8263_length_1509_cov_11.194645.p1 GENE.NODE_8263_length_1509_cov_11.194645~~NODE_8263_length_1509_cov_11.194645.p1  ORF type:complete len:360 (+),score=62.53 NODE_8263_length_1509_cov_11.194645:49-1080(+)
MPLCSYQSPWPAYAMAWASNKDSVMKFALGSFRAKSCNQYIHIVEVNEQRTALETVHEMEMVLPLTKLMWMPKAEEDKYEILAGTTNVLTLWKVKNGHIDKLNALQPALQRPVNECAPLTSFDFSAHGRKRVGSASVDTTCTIWNIERWKKEVQLIAHDTAVLDFAFNPSCENIFGSVGQDGTLRIFDQRSLEHSMILFDTTPATPLLQMAWNRKNPNLIATIAADEVGVIVIDLRKVGTAVWGLPVHGPCFNHVDWCPSVANTLVGAGSDGNMYIIDINDSTQCKKIADGNLSTMSVDGISPPKLVYERHAPASPLYHVEWSRHQPDFLAIGHASGLEVIAV